MSHSTHSNAASTVTPASLLDDAKAFAEKLTILLGPAPALTRGDVQRSTKIRRGGGEMVQTIAALSDKFGLVVPSQPTATLVAKIKQAESLIALQKEMVTAMKHISDSIFLAQSQSWAGATAHYTMLRRLSKLDGNVGKALEPVSQFFAARSTAVAEKERADRGGARKRTAKAKAYRASKRARDAATLAQAESAAPAPTPPAGPTGPSPLPAAMPTNGAARS